ncbi:putative mediator of RNA polymerase II transcription subunit 26 [Penaeus monodon]|uniref:putative mediator of RNA polymerase II transcription subunit 26 n=1 Tax=Penaeus monodon TaxID=6687 RepID=UPI0018A7319E|nr:putative mediator of RNA polymerase II transcription subunit 26 [Penaeus monodon]
MASRRQQEIPLGHQILPDKYFASQAPYIAYLSLWPRQMFGQESQLKNIRPQRQHEDSYDSRSQQNDFYDLQTQESTSSYLLKTIDGLETDHRQRIGLTLDLTRPHSEHSTQQTQQNDFPGKQMFSHTEFHFTSGDNSDLQQPHNLQNSEFRQENAFENNFFEQHDNETPLKHKLSQEQNGSQIQLQNLHTDKFHHGNLHGTQFQQDNLHNKFKRDSQHAQIQQEKLFINDQILQQKSMNSNQDSHQNQQFQHVMNNHQLPHGLRDSQFQQQTAFSNNQFHQEILSNNPSQQRQLPNNNQFQHDTSANNSQFQQQNHLNNNYFQQEILPHNESHPNRFKNNNLQQETLPAQKFQEEILPNRNPLHENLEIKHILNLQQEQTEHQTDHNEAFDTSVNISQDQVTSTAQQNRQLESAVLFHGQSERDIHQSTQLHPHNQSGLRERNPQNTQLHPFVINSTLTEEQNNINPQIQNGIIVSSRNHVNNSFKVQKASHNSQFTTAQQIEQLESLILPNGQSESSQYKQSEVQIPQTLQTGWQILLTGQAEQSRLQNTQVDEQTQSRGFREQRNTQQQPDSHIQAGEISQSHPQQIQSDLILAVDAANKRPRVTQNDPLTQVSELRETKKHSNCNLQFTHHDRTPACTK